jgi:L-asparaginase
VPSNLVRHCSNLCEHLAVLRMVPGFSDDYIHALIDNTPTLKGIILQLYGTGNASQRKGSFVGGIRKAISKGIVVVASTQCVKGGVKLDTYA